jgi:multidrug resistance efflux pump
MVRRWASSVNGSPNVTSSSTKKRRVSVSKSFQIKARGEPNGLPPEEIEIGEAGVGVALARAEEARATLDHAHGLQVGISITRAQLLVAERDFRIADAVLVDARKKLALLKVGSRFEAVAEAKDRRDSAAAFLDEGKADLDQCSVRTPAAGTIKVLVTLGHLVSTHAPTTLIQLTPDAK